MDGGQPRERRTCVRCGRVGFNAFRPVSPVDQRAWACTHFETCAARARLRRRSVARRADGRPATSSIAPPDLTDKPACVIGSNDASVEHVEQVIAGATATDVDRLGLDRRSLNLLSRRDYGLLVFDAQPDDSIAMLNELGRRLSSVRRKGTLVLVCRDRERSGPALERLTTQADAITLERPIRALTVLEVAGLTRSAPDAVAV